MNLIPIHLATEDELSELALIKIVSASRRFAIGSRYRKGGFGYLRRTIHGWNNAAKGTPFLVLTDLDSSPCPSALIENWLSVPKNHNLLFRVAVREVESWLLADSEGISNFLGVKPSAVPYDADLLPDPKATLVSVASIARRRELRDAIVPRRGSTAKQGPDYNGCLGRFVRDAWSVEAAMTKSPSLARTVKRLEEFIPHWRSAAPPVR